MEIFELREYVLLSRTMNFTKAAQELHVSQSALSNHIMKIERELGVQLVDRSHGKISLTVAGYEFLESASKIINVYDGFIAKCEQREFSTMCHFVLQTLQHADFATHVLLQRVEGFKERHPEAQIEIRESLAFDTIDNMKKGITDCGYLGILLHRPQLEEGFEAAPVLREELIVWIDKRSPLYLSELLSPHDLENCEIPTWVGIGPNGLEEMYQQIFSEYDMKMKYSPRYCISREDYFLNKIMSNDAVILTEGSEAIHSISVREDRALRGFNPPLYVNTYMVFRSDEPPESGVGQFRAYLIDQMEQDQHAATSVQ